MKVLWIAEADEDGECSRPVLASIDPAAIREVMRILERLVCGPEGSDTVARRLGGTSTETTARRTDAPVKKVR